MTRCKPGEHRWAYFGRLPTFLVHYRVCVDCHREQEEIR